MRKLMVATIAATLAVFALPAVAGPIVVTQPSVERAAQPPATVQEAGWHRGWHHGWHRHYGRHRHVGWRHHRHW